MHGSVHLFDRLPQVVRPQVPARPVAAPARQVPLVGVIRNPRSRLKAGPLPDLDGRATLLDETPEKRSDLIDVLARFAERQVDYIVIAGGDGTVRDVLTNGSGFFGDAWPTLLVVPCGKTNALAVDLGLPTHWTFEHAFAAIAGGHDEVRRPLVIAQADNPDARVLGFVFGAGAFVRSIQLGQKAHDKGAFNNLGVGLTTIWALAQALFGGSANVWRRGTKMRLADEAGEEVEHSGLGPVGERYFLFGSTLTRFPAGMKPLGERTDGMQMAIIDHANRGVLLRLPLVIRGLAGTGMRRFGYRVLRSDSLRLDIADRFILDGEAFPAGDYRITLGPKLRFVVP